MVATRFRTLDADVPQWFATTDIGLHVDEGYKTLSPRNLIEEGSTHWHELDDYPGWFGTSPVTQTAFYLAMKVGNVDLQSVRIVSVLTFTLLLFAYLAAFSRHYPPLAMAVGALVLASDPLLFHFSRVALFEVFLALITALALVSVHVLRNRSTPVAILVLIAFAALGTVSVKASALVYVAPAIAAMSAYHVWTSCRRWAVAASYVLALIPVVGVAFIMRGDWIPFISAESLMSAPARLFASRIAAFDPVVALATTGVVLHGVSVDPRRYLADRYRLALIATFFGVPLILSSVDYAPLRYFTAMMVTAPLLVADYVANRVWSWPVARHSSRILWAPSAVVAIVAVWFLLRSIDYAVLERLPFPLGNDPGLSAETMLEFFPWVAVVVIATHCAVRHRVLRTSIPPGCIALSVVTAVGLGSADQLRAHFEPTYLANGIREQIESRVSRESSVAGDWAPYLTFGTARRALYMNEVFNRAESAYLMRPDYFLYAGTLNDQISLEVLSSDCRLLLGEGVNVGVLLGRPIDLYEITYPIEIDAEYAEADGVQARGACLPPLTEAPWFAKAQALR